SRRQQVFTCVGGQTPVVVLTASVYTLVWFLMEQHSEVVSYGHLFHHIHDQLVVIHCNINFFIYRSTLKLSGRHLMVTGTPRKAQQVCLEFKIMHESKNTLRNGTPVMIFKLLAFGRGVTKKCAAVLLQFVADVIPGSINEKIFLFPA